jgi:hypothetical protein
VKLVEDKGILALTSEQTEELCTIAEEAARKYILSKVPRKSIEKLNVSAEAEGTRPMNLEIEVDVGLSPMLEEFDVQQLVNEAVREGFRSAERYLGELECHSRK